MDRDEIIMNFSIPPSIEDLEILTRNTKDTLPEELMIFCENLTVQVEDFPDSAIEDELDLDEPYDLLALFRSGSQIAPGIKSKVANDDDVLIIFRRPLLDMWCETSEDLSSLIRQIIIEELARNFDFSDEEIDDMTKQHYQGML